MEKSTIENNKSFKPILVQDEMSSSYLSYAMSVIVSRALPDVRDGLKPVLLIYFVILPIKMLRFSVVILYF